MKDRTTHREDTGIFKNATKKPWKQNICVVSLLDSVSSALQMRLGNFNPGQCSDSHSHIVDKLL